MKKILFFVIFLGLLATFGNEGWMKLYRLRNYEKNLRQENARVAEQNRLLTEQIGLLKETGYLDRLIREDLGFIKDNEILYEVVADQSP